MKKESEEMIMSEKVDGRKDAYVSVDIQVFRNTTKDLRFDLFLRLSETNFAHVFSEKTGLDYKRLNSYVQKGVQRLFIRKSDEDKFKLYVNRAAEDIFEDPTLPGQKRIAALLNMTEQNMTEVFSKVPVNDETALKTKKVVNSYIRLLIEKPSTLAMILKLVSHGDYLYYHSIAVSIFSLFIARASGQFNQRSLETVGMGGFFHDIGCVHFPEGIYEDKPDLSDAEKQIIHAHPKVGLKMIEEAKNIPDEVRYIVYQHHEGPGATGYPNGIRGPVIYYPAKIVAIADAFSSLISQRPFREAMSVVQAIEVLKADRSSFDQRIVEILTSVVLKGQEQRKKKSAA
jgi:putative nucleotidyltransferase with HDIG domain